MTGLNVFAYIEYSHEEEASRAMSHDVSLLGTLSHGCETDQQNP